MNVFKLLKKDLYLFGIIRKKSSSKWNQFIGIFISSIILFSTFSAIASYALSEANDFVQCADAFFFTFGMVLVIASYFILTFQTSKVAKMIDTLETILDERK